MANTSQNKRTARRIIKDINMEIKVKPITDTKQSVSQTFLKVIYRDCPIVLWCKEQELKNKKIKL
jgi:hypothetical protein